MSDFLETLKQRQADAQRRLATATSNLQKAQQEHQQISQEFASWSNAVAAESRREQDSTRDSGQQLPKPETPKPVVTASGTVVFFEDSEPVAEVNKTHLIREVLQQNPSGLRPVSVWQRLQDQVPRAYVYSVLSRMKQKKQVRESRGKYFLIQPAPKTIEEKPVAVGVN
jgi:hypothetical protein